MAVKTDPDGVSREVGENDDKKMFGSPKCKTISCRMIC